MGREVARSRYIPVLVKATTNRHDRPRTVLLAALLDQVNCVRQPADERCVDHCGFPYLATARPVAVARRLASPPLQNVNQSAQQVFLTNAYRVLLTRARQGMVIYIPRGDENDKTRLREFYDGTFNFLKSCGLVALVDD
jgi:hypothetical protein